MTAFLSGHLISEPVLSVSAAHLSEVDRIQASDAEVQRMVHDLCDAIQRAGTLLPTVHSSDRHRYAELCDRLTDALSDGMPAPREAGDDPFDDGEG
jgi:hypothetical protein